MGPLSTLITPRARRISQNGKSAAADQDYRKRVERLTERQGLRRSEGFAPATAEGMKQDGVFRARTVCQDRRAISRRQRKDRRTLRTERPGETQGSVDSVGTGIDRDEVGMKKAGAFAAIAEADADWSPAGAGGQATAKETLKVEGHLRLQAGRQLLQPGPEPPEPGSAAELFAGEKDRA
jgi:hypothetical protein